MTRRVDRATTRNAGEVPVPDQGRPGPGDTAYAIERLTAELEAVRRQLTERDHALGESYRSLEDAFKRQAALTTELERTMQTRSDFVAVASHELRSPLAVIRLYAEMLEEGEFGEMGPAPREAIASIVAAASRLTSIVSDLMDVSLLDRGLLPLRFSRVNLDELVERAVADAVNMGRGWKIDVRMEPGATGVVVHADALRVRQVVDNLLTNAIKYSDQSNLVTVRVVALETEAEVRVTDRGRGIPEEKRQVLFALFGKVDMEDNAEQSGLGLGLAISLRIARAHGGSIRFEEGEEGQGSVFVLRLPYELPYGADDRPGTVSVVGQ
jgi:signal transduction histidine kinase